MKHWGRPPAKNHKFPPAVGKTIFPEERVELERQAQRAIDVAKHARLPKMPKVEAPTN